MQVHFGVELLQAEWESAVACIGTFDGVHLGHQQVISTAVQQAQSREWPCVLVTFDRHPAHVLAPEKCPKTIASLQSNLANFAKLDVAAAVILPFDVALSQTSASDFFADVLRNKVKAHAIVVGHDFGFGRGREGSPEWLRERIETAIVPPFEVAGRRVSSSEIRRAISDGRVEDAALLLGRPFEINGVVISGEKLGRTLGYPTINIARSFDQVGPANGVYSGYVECKFGHFTAAVSIGTRPTVGGSSRTIEAFLLDYPGASLYGSSVILSITRRLRDEVKFDSIEGLKIQMAKDIEDVRL